MNASDILKYGHLTVLKTLQGLPQNEWDTAGVCGYWSVKEIIAHLASFEYVLEEVFNLFLIDAEPGPYMTKWTNTPGGFNDQEVDLRKNNPQEQVLAEYSEMQALNWNLVKQIPAKTRRQVGAIPWYGSEYALDDFIVYTFYGHKREHCAQINVFKDQFIK